MRRPAMRRGTVGTSQSSVAAPPAACAMVAGHHIAVSGASRCRGGGAAAEDPAADRAGVAPPRAGEVVDRVGERRGGRGEGPSARGVAGGEAGADERVELELGPGPRAAEPAQSSSTSAVAAPARAQEEQQLDRADRSDGAVEQAIDALMVVNRSSTVRTNTPAGLLVPGAGEGLRQWDYGVTGAAGRRQGTRRPGGSAIDPGERVGSALADPPGGGSAPRPCCPGSGRSLPRDAATRSGAGSRLTAAVSRVTHTPCLPRRRGPGSDRESGYAPPRSAGKPGRRTPTAPARFP